MQAMVQFHYGSPDVLQLAEVAKPEVDANRVLVQVYATSVTAGDRHLMRGTPWLVRLMYGGLWRPKIPTLGCDLAGRVVAVGEQVTRFKPGDEVFGELSASGFGAWAEYALAPESALQLKPGSVSFTAAACVPCAGLAALQGLRDCGQLAAGQRVLIIGAASGVGSFAVQMAKAWSAQVTAVCSEAKMPVVRALGADRVMYYAAFEAAAEKAYYDVIFNAACYRSVFDFLPLLKSGGVCVVVGGSIARIFQAMLLGPLVSRFSTKALRCLVSKPTEADLACLADLLAEGKIAPVIDQVYSFEQLPAALRQLEQRQVAGKLAVEFKAASEASGEAKR